MKKELFRHCSALQQFFQWSAFSAHQLLPMTIMKVKTMTPLSSLPVYPQQLL